MSKRKYGFLENCDLYNVKDKQRNVHDYIRYMLNRTQSIFDYTGLPETISKRNLELLLQINGYACITKVNDELYAFFGGLGGEPDAYYMPTICTVANPALNFNANLKIDEDCVIIPNDSLYIGLLPINRRYASALVENDITLHMVDINARTMGVPVASDDKTAESINVYYEHLIDGDMKAPTSKNFMSDENFKLHPFSSTAHNGITDLIEYEQYIKASWFNELGVNANYNMKRESINGNESDLNNQSLLPLIDNMLETRRDALEKVNAMFGTNITVSLSSAWANAHDESNNCINETEESEEKDNEEKEKDNE